MNGPEDLQKRQDSEVAKRLVENINHGATTYRIGIIIGQCFGGITCLAGMVLLALGIAGQIEWVVKAGNLSSRLANASPGALFAVIGLIILWRYKPIITDDLSIKPGGQSSSVRRKMEELQRISDLQASWRSKGDDIHYHGSK